MAELESIVPSSTVFIDVDAAPATSQFPIIQEEAPKLDQNDDVTSALTSVEPQPRRIRCPECKRYTAETEEKMLRHVRKVHRGENPFQCFMCDYSTYNKVLFEEHVRIHQGIKPYKCSHCPYRSVSKKNTKKHELIHRPDNPHKCVQCGFIARHLRALQHHTRAHAQSTTGDTQKKTKKKCKECKKSFSTRLYSQHCLEVHGIQVKSDKKKRKPVSKKNIFKCAICSWEGNTKPRILLHLIHHPNQEVDDNVVDTLILRELGIMRNRGTDSDNEI